MASSLLKTTHLEPLLDEPRSTDTCVDDESPDKGLKQSGREREGSIDSKRTEQ